LTPRAESMIVCIRSARLVLICVALLTHAATVRAQSGANVLVVINSASAASETIGRQYAARRGVPDSNLCAIQPPVRESISREVYDAQIERPIWKCIAARQAHDRILYIVLTKDVPLRIDGSVGRSGTHASVDSELTLLYRRRTDESVPLVGFVPNPYYAGTAAPAPVTPFSHRAHDIYLVTRLDGYTVDDALALIERAATAATSGVFVLEPRAAAGDLIPNRWLATAAEQLSARGFAGRILDGAAKLPADASPVLGYYSWSSIDAEHRGDHAGIAFQPGALAGMFVSTDGRTFREPPHSWRPGDGEPFAGTSDPLVGSLIRAGVTGVSGNVNEPYLDASIRPDILFPAYASGRNLAEPFYAAMPYLSWQTIILGDPLCSPFSQASVSSDEMDPPIDTATQLPAYFAKRQLATMYPELARDAAAAFVRFQYRILREDAAGAREALKAAIAAEPRFLPARVELAVMDEREGNIDEAMRQYRAILTYSPNDPLALNNLAYALATHKHNPEEALPIAERATIAARTDPTLLGGSSILNYYTLGTQRREPLIPYSLDTLAWVQHLLGRDAEALKTLLQARAAGGVHTADMMWHAAVIYAAANDPARAATELNAALSADPAFANRAEVKKLRQQLGEIEK